MISFLNPEIFESSAEHRGEFDYPLVRLYEDDPEVEEEV